MQHAFAIGFDATYRSIRIRTALPPVAQLIPATPPDAAASCFARETPGMRVASGRWRKQSAFLLHQRPCPMHSSASGGEGPEAPLRPSGNDAWFRLRGGA